MTDAYQQYEEAVVSIAKEDLAFAATLLNRFGVEVYQPL